MKPRQNDDRWLRLTDGAPRPILSAAVPWSMPELFCVLAAAAAQALFFLFHL